MSDKRLETSENPEIIVLANERLSIRGWDQSAVEANCAKDGCSLSVQGDAVRAEGESNLELRVPHASSLKVTGFGEIIIRDVSGSVHIEQAGGNLSLRDVGTTSAQSVGDDLTARSVGGDLVVNHVGRYLNIRGISGNLSADFVGGHVNVKGVQGNVAIETDGNTNISADELAGRTVQVKSAGVITCKVAPGLNARVSIGSFGPISIKTVEKNFATNDGSLEETFGEGSGQITLNAEGPVSLTESMPKDPKQGFDFDFDLSGDLSDLGGTIGEQVAGQLEMISEQLEARMSGLSKLVNLADVSAGDADEIKKRTEEKVARAQEKIRRAQDRAARKIAAAQRRAEGKARRADKNSRKEFSRSFKIDLQDLKKLKDLKTSAKSKSDPVSDEERLIILNMVAEQKITLEEAEALLSALDGN